MSISIRRALKEISIIGKLYMMFKKKMSRIRFKVNSIMTKKITEEDLLKQFAEIGLRRGDKVIINSSMSKIGVLKDGPKTFVNALMKYISEDGLIVMSTYPHTNSYKYLENYQVFDVNKTPSKNGVLTEYFRNQERVFRSIHPTHPLAAWGKDSKTIMSGHELSKTRYGEKSPYKKLLDINVKVLLIGVNLNHAVMFRAIDDIYKDYPINPYIPNKIYKVKVLGYNGEVIEIETPCDDPEFSKERNNMAIYPYLKDKIKFGKLGLADTWLFSSKVLYETQVECSKNGILPYYKFPLKGRK